MILPLIILPQFRPSTSAPLRQTNVPPPPLQPL